MEEIDLKEICKSFWNKKWQILIIMLICIGAGIIYTNKFVTPRYTASTTLILASSNQYQTTTSSSVIEQDLTLNSRLVSTYSVLIKSKNILSQVISDLKLNITEDELKGCISVGAVEGTEIIQIDVTHTDQKLATQIANEVAKVFMVEVKEYYTIDNVQVVDVAEEPGYPSNINHKRDIIIFALLGCIISASYVFVINMLDTTIKSVEDLENICKVTVLAAIPMGETYLQKKNGRRKSNEAKRTSNI